MRGGAGQQSVLGCPHVETYEGLLLHPDLRVGPLARLLTGQDSQGPLRSESLELRAGQPPASQHASCALIT